MVAGYELPAVRFPRGIVLVCAAAVWVALAWLCGVQTAQDLLANAIALQKLAGADEILLSLSVTPAGAFAGTLRSAAPALVLLVGGVMLTAMSVTARRRVSPRSTQLCAAFAFASRRERRDDSLHYASEHFWLRIRGR